MNRSIERRLKNLFWKLPIPGIIKEKLRHRYSSYKFETEQKQKEETTIIEDDDKIHEYLVYLFDRFNKRNKEYKEYIEHQNTANDVKLIVYYLTQYSPDVHNDLWWGKGSTEWDNVSKAIPQFTGHNQPRLPGELGFYDLRVKDVMRRQIEIAKNYGIDVFNFYYYWFNEERLLEKPFEMFFEDKSLNMPFMLCWVNENWTKKYSGTDDSVLIGMENTEDNYKRFIHSVLKYFDDDRYFCINDRFVLQVYRPSLIPNIKEIIDYWQTIVNQKYGKKLYLIACQERDASTDWCSKGFDAENEWMMGSAKNQCLDITNQIKPIRSDFSGEVFDYYDLVKNKRYYIKKNRTKKVYPAIMPSWDNTARRNNRGTIFHNSSPELYYEWMTNLISEVKEQKYLDIPMIFINAWNEWGEGAYMEPDREYGYAYLEANWKAKNNKSFDN